MMLKTNRLILKQMTEENIDDLKDILQDNITMTHYGGAFDDDSVQTWFNRNLLRYKTKGLGLLAVFLKDTDTMIGQCGLTMQKVEENEVLEVGYLFNKNYWHKGYATEASQACIKYAFEKLNVNIVYSTIRDTNIPSMNVAIRNHMKIYHRYNKLFKDIIMPHYLFGVSKEVYYAKNNTE